MKGSYEIKVSRGRGTKYAFTVKRNITVIRGDSGTGKTTLYEMIADHARFGDESGVSVQCDCSCVALTDSDWAHQLAGFKDSIVFIDEGFEDIFTDDFARMVRGSSNYFVLITRADIPSLSYSVNEVYRIKTSGKFHSLESAYPMRETCRYALGKAKPKADFDVLLTEDSKSGHQFFARRLSDGGVACESAETNSNILKWLDGHSEDRVFVVADGVAFGPYADRVLKLQDSRRDNITVCLPESFEWLLLRSGVVGSSEAERVLQNPGAYIDGAKYMSWEQFFTDLLRREAKGTAFEYAKAEIADAYCVEANASRVMALIACRNIR